jgi:peptide-methionine (R)-S-oxide reductase
MELTVLDRRLFLLSGLSLAACSAQGQADEAASAGIDTDIFEAPGVVPWGAETIDYAAQSEDWWRERLTREEFRILRQEGTERAGTSPLNNEHRQGLYVCAGCGLPLFTSATKYESGTGWPSFWAPIEGALDTKPDYRLWTPRTEYHCRRCKGHQGHVFNDGPRPTGERWCNNGLALDFIPDPRV